VDIKITGIHAMITILFIVVSFGSLHLLAMSMPDSPWAKAWIGGLGF